MSLLQNRIVSVIALATFTGFGPTLASAAEETKPKAKADEGKMTAAPVEAPKAVDPKTADKKVKEEYVYITVTGSNIPKKIKKSDIEAGKLPKDLQMQLMEKEQFGKRHSAPIKGN